MVREPQLVSAGPAIDSPGAELPSELPSLTEFARRLAFVPRRPSAGATAALAVALAADLVTQVAERSTDWQEHGGVVAQADVLRERAVAAGGEVAIVYHELVEALDTAVADPGVATGSMALADMLISAAHVLIKIAETACDCAVLALVVAKSGDIVVRADASAAAILASSAADMVAHLVEVNLLANSQPELTAHARRLANAAALSRSAAVAIPT
jgi:formiminotetrahydrofolate cyclodeaminase